MQRTQAIEDLIRVVQGVTSHISLESGTQVTEDDVAPIKQVMAAGRQWGGGVDRAARNSATQYFSCNLFIAIFTVCNSCALIDWFVTFMSLIFPALCGICKPARTFGRSWQNGRTDGFFVLIKSLRSKQVSHVSVQ